MRPADSHLDDESPAALPLREPSTVAPESPAPSGDQVLEFLHDLRFDPRRCRNLNSGRNLLLEAAEAGLVELAQLDRFVARLGELHEAGLVGWTFAPHDVNGDDLPHAAEFHVTDRGRRRLASHPDSHRGEPRPAESAEHGGEAGRV